MQSTDFQNLTQPSMDMVDLVRHAYEKGGKAERESQKEKGKKSGVTIAIVLPQMPHPAVLGALSQPLLEQHMAEQQGQEQPKQMAKGGGVRKHFASGGANDPTSATNLAGDAITGGMAVYSGSTGAGAGLGNWIDTSQLGQSVGLGTSTAPSADAIASAAAAPNADIGPSLADATLPSVPTETGAALSSAMADAGWGGIGTVIGNVAGLPSNQNPLVNAGMNIAGSLGGAALGSAAGGALGGTIAGMEAGSVLGPIGAIGGALIGTLAGSLFGPNPSVGPDANTTISGWDSTNNQPTYAQGAGNGGSSAISNALMQQAYQNANNYISKLGGQITNTAPLSTGYFKGKYFVSDTNAGGNATYTGNQFSDPNAAIQDLTQRIVEASVINGLTPTQLAGIGNYATPTSPNYSGDYTSGPLKGGTIDAYNPATYANGVPSIASLTNGANTSGGNGSSGGTGGTGAGATAANPTLDQQITNDYLSTLGRAPSSSELSYYESDPNYAAHIAASPEASSLTSNIQKTFTADTGRPADAATLAYYAADPNYAAHIAAAPESQNYTANATTINNAANTVLGQPADPATVAALNTALNNGTLTTAGIPAALKATSQYTNNVNAGTVGPQGNFAPSYTVPSQGRDAYTVATANSAANSLVPTWGQNAAIGAADALGVNHSQIGALNGYMPYTPPPGTGAGAFAPSSPLNGGVAAPPTPLASNPLGALNSANPSGTYSGPALPSTGTPVDLGAGVTGSSGSYSPPSTENPVALNRTVTGGVPASPAYLRAVSGQSTPVGYGTPMVLPDSTLIDPITGLPITAASGALNQAAGA